MPSRSLPQRDFFINYLKNNSVLLHYRNIKALVTEVFKVYKRISSSIMKEIFQLNRPLNYDIRHLFDFSTGPVKSVYYCRESLV